MKGHQSRPHVRSVRVSQGNQVGCALSFEEFGQINGLHFHIVFVKHTFLKPPKPSRHPVFIHFPPRTEDGRARQQLLSNPDEVTLRPSCSVEEQEGSFLIGICCWLRDELKTHRIYPLVYVIDKELLQTGFANGFLRFKCNPPSRPDSVWRSCLTRLRLRRIHRRPVKTQRNRPTREHPRSRQGGSMVCRQ